MIGKQVGLIGGELITHSQELLRITSNYSPLRLEDLQELRSYLCLVFPTPSAGFPVKGY